MGNEMSDHIIPPSLVRYIATRDKRHPFTTSTLQMRFEELIRFGTVHIGGLCTAGRGNLHPSWTYYTSWNEIVRKAQRLGYEIEIVKDQHVPSKTTAMSGGYPQANYYHLKSVPGCAHGDGS
jgi:hypothetical protein